MDCSEFQAQHACFVDGALPSDDTARLADHRAQCAKCAALDTSVRRALLIARNAPGIALSDQFRDRLSARLAHERVARRDETRERSVTRILAAAAAVVLLVASVVGVRARRAEAVAPVTLAPVVVSRPAIVAEPVGAPAVFATMAGGFPVYPAVLLAQHASEYFAESQARAAAAALASSAPQ
jgi:hypothetical protein